MIFVCDEEPKACAGCGRSITFCLLGREMWDGGASIRCECGSSFQKAMREAILTAASEIGDLARYA